MQEIINNDVQFNHTEFDNISNHAKDLILQLLNKNPTERITCSDALNHEWFRTLTIKEPTSNSSTRNFKRKANKNRSEQKEGKDKNKIKESLIDKYNSNLDKNISS